MYFAPRRFTAVQLAFDNPRSRTLLFHTGRIVGTGTNGPQAARLAVARAIRAIATQAGVFIGIRRFSVINQVGAVALGSSIDCDAFANAHSGDSHYDKSSFVGLAVTRLVAFSYSRLALILTLKHTVLLNAVATITGNNMRGGILDWQDELARFSSRTTHARIIF